MLSLLFRGAVLVALVGITATANAGVESSGCTTISSQTEDATHQKRFSWDGGCTVKCKDGKCEWVCDSGVVLAINERDAKWKAEAALRARASRKGLVVEGSFRINIRF